VSARLSPVFRVPLAFRFRSDSDAVVVPRRRSDDYELGLIPFLHTLFPSVRYVPTLTKPFLQQRCPLICRRNPQSQARCGSRSLRLWRCCSKHGAPPRRLRRTIPLKPIVFFVHIDFCTDPISSGPGSPTMDLSHSQNLPNLWTGRDQGAPRTCCTRPLQRRSHARGSRCTPYGSSFPL